MAVVIDQPVADFEAPATSGQTVSLSALKGKQVVIYFYPKDSTPGCTTQGQGFRDQYAAFKAANTEGEIYFHADSYGDDISTIRMQGVDGMSIHVHDLQATVLRHRLSAGDTTAVINVLLEVVRATGGPVLDRVRATHVLRVATTGERKKGSASSAVGSGPRAAS